MTRNAKRKVIAAAGVVISGVCMLMRCAAKIRAGDKDSDAGQPCIEQTSASCSRGRYEHIVKGALDKCISFFLLILLSPLYAAVALAVYVDDPGPVFFVQERVGKDGRLFKLHKFRTMMTTAPHDVPTHQLEDPDKYITRAGRFLRKTSLDELPQAWDIFKGEMSIIGPRPALRNQEDLIAEREKYGANSVKPGLTGWAQINGRDELDTAEKARYDGEYVRHLKQGGIKALFFDARCFAGTVVPVLKKDGVAEGGAGQAEKLNEYERDAKADILVVCQYYYPESFQVTPVCEALAADGYTVTVLTGLPNYPSGTVPDEYKKGRRNEVINGVRVVRCFESGRKKGVFCLALNYITFAAAALRKAGKLGGRHDIVICYQLSPVFMGLPAVRYAKKHKVPYLHYCCDIWPESAKMYLKDERTLLFKAVKKISGSVYRTADKIIVQSLSFIDYLGKTHGINTGRFTYIPAFADESYLTNNFAVENTIIDFVFLGNLGIAQDLFSVLKAVKKNRDIPNFQVHFVGEGVCLNGMKRYVEENGLENIVRFYGRRPAEEMPEFYKLADACLVSLKADNETGYTVPSKIQGYMAAGKPVIAMIDGSARDVIEDSQCGICVRAGDIDALSAAIKNFVKNPERYRDCGEKGREYFKANFMKSNCIRKLEDVIDEMVKERR